MASAQSPAINKGERIPFTSGPFLGKKRVNKVIAICNALNNLDVNVVSIASTGNAALDAQLATTGGLVMDSQGHAILTVPVPPATTSSGTNTPGWHWTAGQRNYNPATSYVDQQMIYVQESSAAATTGLPDIDSLTTVKSIPGIYVCLQANSGTIIGGTAHYHVPQIPLPTPDDMEASNNYWMLISMAPQCI
jgi:hypothetical protein